MKSDVEATPQRLHLGCGPGPQPAGWIHVDGSWNARFAKVPRLRELANRLGILPEKPAQQIWQRDIVVANLRRRLPFSTDSFDAVYSSHVLEHLYEPEAYGLLSECVRILKPGGVLRIVVPDLQAMVRLYQESKGVPPSASEHLPADCLNESLLLRTRELPKGFLLHRIYMAFTDFHTHKWMYDAQSLTYRMIKVGLSDVEERPVWISRIPKIKEIETPKRLVDGVGVCVEGVKPLTTVVLSPERRD
jgi:predicted SAM-dependent methyltransferase